MAKALMNMLRNNGTNGIPYTVGTNSVTGRQVLTGVKGIQTGGGGPRPAARAEPDADGRAVASLSTSSRSS